ncbi:hypothetical protein [Marinobacter lutaoensis]|jgi:hypothetical protein|uniref:hypothetical protein n=1 Tax=Marinobacter lutaoensis TaxID=135739 RepID=UPI0015930D28|nr:hypothetical protein [Marinobacter lutaoensis]NVD37148.1 hypothetical protein [Marinobacter lutaoensis]
MSSEIDFTLYQELRAYCECLNADGMKRGMEAILQAKSEAPALIDKIRRREQSRDDLKRWILLENRQYQGAGTPDERLPRYVLANSDLVEQAINSALLQENCEYIWRDYESDGEKLTVAQVAEREDGDACMLPGYVELFDVYDTDWIELVDNGWLSEFGVDVEMSYLLEIVEKALMRYYPDEGEVSP